MTKFLRTLLAVVGLNASGVSPASATGPYGPYAQPGINQIYNLLFCDELSAYNTRPGETPAPWQTILFSAPISDDAVRALAEDRSAESRVRILAYNLLRERGKAVPKGKLFAVIVEMPLDNGLDVVAVFADGTIRYINQSGKLAVVEGGLAETQPVAGRMLDASQRIVSIIGPWEKQRLPPPAKPNVRLTFLVSDGLYFGEGPMSVMERDANAGPIIREALNVVLILKKAVVDRQKDN
jgi:hypothetical protein